MQRVLITLCIFLVLFRHLYIFLVTMSIQILCSFSIGLAFYHRGTIFFIYSGSESLVKWNKGRANFFSFSSTGSIFTSLIMSFEVQSFSTLIKCNLFFLLLLVLSVSCLRNHYLTKSYKDLWLCFFFSLIASEFWH